MKRAYALLDIRSADEESRTIDGIANTADIDSYNTILEPAGAQFKLPMPVLYQHNARQPIGHVVDAKVGKDGIRVRIQVAKPGVADFIDEAWALIKNKLVRGLSVGFEPIEEVFDKTFN
jgi:HK97 family phage prohead protease